MKIVTVLGARPQFIKAAAFSRAAAGFIDEVLVHTGQHFDANMSDVFFKELGIPTPAYHLGIGGGTHAEMTGRMMMEIERVLQKEQPDYCMVYGDTNSTIAGALAAVKLLIPVIHVEAGVRMGTLENPEEVNRVLTDHISSVLFTPTQLELDNLRGERLGVDDVHSKAFSVGNIMYDSFLYALSLPWNRDDANIRTLEGDKAILPDKYYYLTCHRQENTYDDSVLDEILKAMNALEYPTIYPVHPRNRERAGRLCESNHYHNILLLQPVGYIDSVNLLNHCEKVATDSGGLQCEAFYAGKQCVTILDNVVWPQTMAGNRNQLSHADAQEITRRLSVEQEIDESYQPFGDGHTAERILEHILHLRK